jgi:hypothetical protein
MRLTFRAASSLSLLFAGIWLLASVPAQAALPQHFFQDPQTEPIQGLLGAGIGDIVWSGRYLWVATESGVARLDPSQGSGMDEADWVTYTELNGIGRGGLSALDAAGDTVWIATVYDTTIAGLGRFNVGAGLSFSHDAGLTWQNLPPETIFDPAKPEFAKGPTTPIYNPCWGLSVDGSTIWAAFFSGSSVRSQDGGLTWKNLKVRFDDNGQPLPGHIGGNWVVALERQFLADGSTVIWAGTRATDQESGGANSISFSRDNGLTWTVTGPTHAWGFAFTANKVWAGTDQGLFASPDQGLTWAQVEVADLSIRDQLRGTFVGLETFGDTLWVGAENGLGLSTDEGQTWRIVSGLIKTLSVDTGERIGPGGILDEVSTYAAPNPFAPLQGDQARIVYSLAGNTEVTVKIYDFASRLVRTLVEDAPRSGQQRHVEVWDGRDGDDDPVANGVYLYRIELGSGKQVFGKVVVLD